MRQRLRIILIALGLPLYIGVLSVCSFQIFYVAGRAWERHKFEQRHPGLIELIEKDELHKSGGMIQSLRIRHPRTNDMSGAAISWRIPSRCSFLGSAMSYNQGKNNASYTHGMTNTPVYGIWLAMKQRCLNPNTAHYHRYKGLLCKRWHSFENFYADMGDRHEGKSIDRIDNEKGYCKSNCRWATRVQQTRNMRSNVLIVIDGKTKCAAEWVKHFGMVGYFTAMKRIRMGWDPGRAVSQPPRKLKRVK